MPGLIKKAMADDIVRIIIYLFLLLNGVHSPQQLNNDQTLDTLGINFN